MSNNFDSLFQTVKFSKSGFYVCTTVLYVYVTTAVSYFNAVLGGSTQGRWKHRSHSDQKHLNSHWIWSYTIPWSRGTKWHVIKSALDSHPFKYIVKEVYFFYGDWGDMCSFARVKPTGDSGIPYRIHTEIQWSESLGSNIRIYDRCKLQVTFYRSLIKKTLLRVCFFEMIWKNIIDPRSLGSQCIKGSNESTLERQCSKLAVVRSSQMTKKFTGNQFLVKWKAWLPQDKITDNPAKNRKWITVSSTQLTCWFSVVDVR